MRVIEAMRDPQEVGQGVRLGTPKRMGVLVLLQEAPSFFLKLVTAVRQNLGCLSNRPNFFSAGFLPGIPFSIVVRTLLLDGLQEVLILLQCLF